MGRTKRKEGFHVVLTTHNSRISQRIVKYEIKKGRPRLLNLEQEITLTKVIGEIIRENTFKYTSYNTCQDHVYLILVCERPELSRIVGVIKGKSSFLFNCHPSNRLQSIDHDKGINSLGELGGKPIRNKEDKKRPLWSQKFFRAELDIWLLAKLDTQPGYLYLNSHLNNATNYIRTNRQRHRLKPSKELESIIDSFIISEEEAFMTIT